jgi:peroxiredoxin
MLCITAFSMGFGRGRVCVSAKDPEALKRFAGEAGIDVTTEAGFMAEALKALAEVGINGVAGAAMVCDGHYQLMVVVGAGDADAAARALGV